MLGARIRSAVLDDAVAFTANVPPETKDQRWRAATYDTFGLKVWLQSDTTSVPVPTNITVNMVSSLLVSGFYDSATN